MLNQKGFSLISVVALVILVLAAAGYFFTFNSNTNDLIMEDSTNVELPVVTPIDAISAWKTELTEILNSKEKFNEHFELTYLPEGYELNEDYGVHISFLSENIFGESVKLEGIDFDVFEENNAAYTQVLPSEFGFAKIMNKDYTIFVLPGLAGGVGGHSGNTGTGVGCSYGSEGDEHFIIIDDKLKISFDVETQFKRCSDGTNIEHPLQTEQNIEEFIKIIEGLQINWDRITL